MTKRDWIFGEPRETVRNIVRDVARASGVTPSDIFGPTKRGPIARARHAAMYLARTKTGKSYPQIGAVFGRDHSTVMAAVRKVSDAPHRYPIGELE